MRWCLCGTWLGLMLAGSALSATARGDAGGAACPADLDQNAQVNQLDFLSLESALAGAAVSGGVLKSADLDGDTDVDLADFAVFQENFDHACAGGPIFVRYRYRVRDAYGGSSAAAIAASDLDADGDLDLARTNPEWDALRIHANPGAGVGFAPLLVETGPANAVVVADVNGDDVPDLVTAQADQWGTVRVLLGRGDGSFATKQTFATGAAAYDLVVADLNVDGTQDLIVIKNADAGLAIFLGTGDGTLGLHQTLPRRASAIAVADANGDGRPDLIIAHGAQIEVLVAAADGSWSSAGTTDLSATIRWVWSLAAVDVNHDSVVDVVYSHRSADGLSVLFGQGDGSFHPTSTALAALDAPTTVTVSDLNGDGYPDIVVPRDYREDIVVLLGRPDGTFAAPAHYAVGQQPAEAVAADLDGDGVLDLAVANAWIHLGDLSVLLGHGDGTFAPERRVDTGGELQRVAVADFDGDGIPDLAVDSEEDLCVHRGLGDVRFVEPREHVVGEEPEALRIADLNTDGHPDIVTGNTYTGDLSLLFGQPGLAFAEEVRIPLSNRPDQVHLADIDGNGTLDLIASDRYYNGSSFLLSDPLAASGFAPELSVVTGLIHDTDDVDGDGLPDLVASWDTGSRRQLRVFLNEGGAFAASEPLGSEYGSGDAVIADLDQDGRSDLVLGAYRTPGDYSLAVGRNAGGGTFAPLEELASGVDPGALAAADLNCDGLVDFVTVHVRPNWGPGYLAVYLGQPDGTVGAPLLFETGERSADVIIADLNGDAWPDIVTANMTVFLNRFADRLVRE